MVKKSLVVSVSSVLTKQGGDGKKPDGYPLGCGEDVFCGSNEVVVNQSEQGAGDFLPHCSRAISG